MNNILIVEDEKLSRMALADMLNQTYKVYLAKNGKQAIDLALNNSDLDLIILDVIMDDIDGFKVCHILKQSAQTRDIPVLFITALSNIKNKIKGFEVGGVDYITKPFQADEVLARVNTHLTMNRLRKELAAQNTRLQNEIEEKNRIDAEREKLIAELKSALSEVKTLQGFLPICAKCKNIRNDDGYWEQIESYVKDRSDISFSHSICPECAKLFYQNVPGLDKATE